jgi:6-phosphogluconolactonase (cycloisomerase 2 family)
MRSLRIRRLLVMAACIAVPGGVIAAAPALGGTSSSAVSARAARGGYIYIESNIPRKNKNTVLRYTYDSSGKINPKSVVKYKTGGSGLKWIQGKSVGAFDADQQVAINPAHTLLFAVNQGSNTIAVFHIGANGNLTKVKGSPFPSRGQNPVSLGPVGNSILEVVNKSQIPGKKTKTRPNMTTFRVNGDGSLTHVPRSTLKLAADASPEQALISPNRKHVFGADFTSQVIHSLLIRKGGRMKEAPGSPQAIDPSTYKGSSVPAGISTSLLSIPLGMTVHPSKPYFYVNAVVGGHLGVYKYDRKGRLKFLTAVDNPGTFKMCWDTMTRNGRALYTSNTGTSDVSVFDTSNPAKPVRIQVLTPKGHQPTTELTIDPTQHFLFVLTPHVDADAGALVATPKYPTNEVHAFRIGPKGTLTELKSSPVHLAVRTIAAPQGIVAISK